MKLTIILPVYNNEKTIDDCLKSIFEQDFPKKDFEVLFIDGSSDRTWEISKKYPVKRIPISKIPNSSNNEEFKRIWGIKHAKGEIIAFIDADNVLVDKDWIKKMLGPFKDKEIAFVDTLYYDYRKNDKIGVKYQALIGGDDPLALYLGLYSRWSYLNNDWTDYPHKDEDKGNYIKSELLDKQKVPPMGSNGFLVRTKIARKFITDSFIHSDFVYELVNSGHNCFAKVKTGIVHNQPQFFPNKVRRIKRRLTNEVKIKYDYGIKKSDMIKTVTYICLVIPVLYDTLRGFVKKPCFAWFFHPVACFGELFLHGYYPLKKKLGFKI